MRTALGSGATTTGSSIPVDAAIRPWASRSRPGAILEGATRLASERAGHPHPHLTLMAVESASPPVGLSPAGGPLSSF